MTMKHGKPVISPTKTWSMPTIHCQV